MVSDQLAVISKKPEDYFFRASASDFKKIPGSPIAYWPNHHLRESFNDHKSLSSIAKPKQGLATTDNDRFLRYWFECSFNNIYLLAKNSADVINSGVTWFPCQKGGGFRKWFGNNEYVVNWHNNGAEIKEIVKKRYGSASKRVVNEHLYFRKGITWSSLSSSSLSMRYVPSGFIFETKGSMCFFESDSTLFTSLGFCNSSIVNPLLQCVSPTLDYHEGPIGKLPIAENVDKKIIENIESIIQDSKIDWNSYATSWDFTSLPLLEPDYRQPTLKATYQQLCTQWQQTTLEMQRLEEENNRIFIEAYGLQDELTPEVPLNEITLTCNPHYRYKGNKTEEELETLLLADTIKEFLSYAVGCMFGRYSLDAPGLILANQGETLDDYFRIIKEKEVASSQLSVISKEDGGEAATDNCKLHTDNSAAGGTGNFLPDTDNVIPILGDNWFTDDITDRFQCFLRTTFGTGHYEENLKFITDAIGKDIRKYFLKDFYKDHLKTYKKRPIYWLFSSPKGSFNALIYMHRYRPDTVSVILGDYLREFRTKLIARREHLEEVSISASATKTEKTKALKQIEKLKKTIDELDIYENEILYPLATQNIEIDLDDGVKVNYKKFGKALKKVVGLS